MTFLELWYARYGAIPLSLRQLYGRGLLPPLSENRVEALLPTCYQNADRHNLVRVHLRTTLLFWSGGIRITRRARLQYSKKIFLKQMSI